MSQVHLAPQTMSPVIKKTMNEQSDHPEASALGANLKKLVDMLAKQDALKSSLTCHKSDEEFLGQLPASCPYPL